MGKGKKDKKKRKDGSGKGAEKAAAKAVKVSEAREEVSEDGARLGGFADALRVGNGFSLVDVDTGCTPAFEGDDEEGEAALEAGHAELSDLLETAPRRVEGRRDSGRCCSSCRAWTPRARAASCATSSASRPAGDARDRVQGADAPRSASTTSSGGSATPCRAPDSSASSTGRTTRTCSSCGCTTSCRAGRVVEALRADQRLRAGGRPLGHPGRQGDDRTSPRTSRRPGSRRTARAAGQALQVQPGDVDERIHWVDYMEAYQVALDKTSTDGRALVRRAGQPQVVRPVRRAAAAPRGAAVDGPHLAARPTSTSRSRRSGSPRAESRGGPGRQPARSMSAPADAVRSTSSEPNVCRVARRRGSR